MSIVVIYEKGGLKTAIPYLKMELHELLERIFNICISNNLTVSSLFVDYYKLEELHLNVLNDDIKYYNLFTHNSLKS